MTRTTRSTGKPRRSSRLMDKGIVSRGDGRHKTPSPGHAAADADNSSADDRNSSADDRSSADDDVSDHPLLAAAKK